MGFLSRLADDRAKRYPATAKVSSNPATGPQPPGRFSFGTQLYGGPRWSDAFKSQPAPSPLQLVENYHALIYAMVSRNRDAVCRLPMRLMADGSRAQGKPRRACDPIKVSRSVAIRAAKEPTNRVSSASVAQIYEIRNHPILDTLDNPDPYGNFTREKLIALICAYMDVVGSAYLVPEGQGWDWSRKADGRAKGPPEFLWVIYPQYTLPIRLAGSPLVDYFRYFNDALPYDSAIWFRQAHSLRDPYGATFSPTYAGEPYRKQEQEQMAIYSQVLAIGPRPNMIASAKDPWMAPGRDEREIFQNDLRRMHAGGYAGNVLVTNGAFEFTPVNYSPADLAGMQISQYDIYALAAIFGQPATYYTVESNLANLQAADKQHARFGVEPRCKAIAATFTRFAKLFDPRLFFQFDPATEDDQVAQAQADKIYVDMGAITINELNEEKKYTPKPWGDAPWLNGSLKQPDMIMADHEQGLEAGRAGIEQTKAGVKSQKRQDDFELRDPEAGMNDTERSILKLCQQTNQAILRELGRAS